MPEILAAYQLLSLLIGAIALCALVWLVVVLAITFTQVLGKFPDFAYGSVVYLDFWVWRLTRAKNYTEAEKYEDRLKDRERARTLHRILELLLIADGELPGNLNNTKAELLAYAKQALEDNVLPYDGRTLLPGVPLRVRNTMKEKNQ